MIQKLRQVTDVRIVGLAVFAIIAIMITWSGLQAIKTNYELEKEIAKLEQRIAVEELENQNLLLRNEYYKSDKYLEIAARRQFNKGAPGETLYQVPKSVALAQTKDYQQAKEKAKKASQKEKAKSKLQKNFEDWVDFLF